MIHTNKLIELADKFPSANEQSGAKIRAQRVINVLGAIKENCELILGGKNDSEIPKLRSTLNENLKELSSIFYESTPTQQKRFITILLERDILRWKEGVVDSYDSFGREIRVKYDTWESFNKLPESQPELKDDQGTVSQVQVIVREKVLLEIYGTDLMTIGKALRKR